MYVYTYKFKTEMYTYISICRHHKQLFTRREKEREGDRFSSTRLYFFNPLYSLPYKMSNLYPKLCYVIYHIFSLSQEGFR